MAERPIVICGLPGSGKTTYLAALWHLVTSRELFTDLRFRSLRDTDASHLNELANRWRNAEPQIRTEVSAARVVSMNLVDVAGAAVRLTFPDLSGEMYRQMWEDRECTPQLAELLEEGDAMLFFIHADKIRLPQWVVDVAAQSRALGLEITDGQVVPWHPRLSPTQVQLVDLLQLFKMPPLEVKFRRLAIILSAWDKVAVEGRSPSQFLADQLPLLNQYLQSASDEWIWKVYGVSAQGGDYKSEAEPMTERERANIEALRSFDQPSRRIQVVDESNMTHDLTGPIAWLMT